MRVSVRNGNRPGEVAAYFRIETWARAMRVCLHMRSNPPIGHAVTLASQRRDERGGNRCQCRIVYRQCDGRVPALTAGNELREWIEKQIDEVPEMGERGSHAT